MVKDPRSLGRAEIRIQQKPRFSCQLRFGIALFNLATMLGCAAVLPDNSIIERLAGFAVPDERCLSLISNANPYDFSAAFLGITKGVLKRCKR